MEDFPEVTGAYAWSVLLQDEGLYVDAADYQPVTGDLVFLDTDEDDKIDRTGIVVQIDTEMDENEAEIITKLYVIEGDYVESEDENDAVCRIEYEIDDAGIIGYGVLPEQADAAEADTDAEIIVEADSENDEAEDGESEAEGDETEAVTVTLSCEGEDYIVTVVYGADAALPDGTELLVSEYASDSENWQNRYEEASELYGWDDDAYDFRLFDISLVADGEEVEPAAEVQVTISLSGKDELTEYTITHYGEDEAEEIEAVSDYADDTQTVSFETDGFSEYSLTSAANPNFTVQYYAWPDVVSTTGVTDVNLTVLDTSGGTLPTNSTRNKKIDLDLAKTDSGDYVVATSEELTEVYSSASYDYTEAPGLEYVNKLAKNTGYEISQIWILKSGKSSDSTSESDWDIYTYTEGMDFTNNAASADEKTILIKDNSYIRIVYDTVDVTSDFKANLYDYDITDGKLYTSNSTSGGTTTSTSGTVYVNTVQQGINSAGNYSGTGTKLAFGNSNTGTGLGTLAVASLSGSTLNQYNRLGNSSGTYVDYGCTFGLVTGLSNGVIQYANGVSAPNLFDDGTATGKTTYTNQNLTFIKEGDTYTLTEVSGSGGVRATGLETFSHLTEYTDGVSGNINIYTNNFWPMDVVSHDNQDLLFGDAYLYANGLKKYINSFTGANLPISDDSKAHNSYFGMQYSVDFTLTSDYVGPLNYYFFGDDDMWVFLTDSNGNSRLVCDIGGVHSSVGEYVNLWDYIDKGSSDTYTLTFYYTERGASGSTCYMRFTLPSVTSSTPVQDTGTLRVEKKCRLTAVMMTALILI
ncbi:MAG: fibro-slime domain-containing protein [Clostridiales bacterium]|nr:fibro-slime domain-containing protein [Clostridiales bacterium]